jgi:serine/threonine protein kinase
MCDVAKVDHPTPEKLAAFGASQLAAAETAVVRAHLETCAACRNVVAAAESETVAPAAHTPASAPLPSPAPAPAPPSNVPPILANHPRYQILGLLGTGGMGAVYKAQHRIMERIVALKVISPELVANPRTVHRFHLEVKAAARLSHRNIVTAFDAEQAGDTHFLVMEYVEGTTLGRMVEKKKQFPVAHACEYIRQAAQGLQHALEQGMVHRDIKPQNLMLTPKGRIKILDFGLARFVSESAKDSGLTALGAVMGTPDYMAPEQAQDAHKADIRSDIYSLGCTLHCLLRGRPPYPEGTGIQKILAHLEQEPPLLLNFRDDVPPELEQVIKRMMAKDPAKRYQTPKDVARALTPIVRAALQQPAKDEKPKAEEAPATLAQQDEGTDWFLTMPEEESTKRPAPIEEEEYEEEERKPRRRAPRREDDWPEPRRRSDGFLQRYWLTLVVAAVLTVVVGSLIGGLLYWGLTPAKTYRLEPPNAGFRVDAHAEFPEPIQKPGDFGVTVYRYEKEHKGAKYSIVYFDLTEIQRGWTDQGMFRGFYDSTLAGFKGAKLLSPEQHIALDGYQGREWLLRLSGGGCIRIRSYRGKDRFYALAVELPKGPDETSESKQFFKSFHITK